MAVNVVKQLKRQRAALAAQIDRLDKALQLLSGENPFPWSRRAGRKRRVSAASRRKMAAAQRRRWAKTKKTRT
jgi:hypothetical protein